MRTLLRCTRPLTLILGLLFGSSLFAHNKLTATSPIDEALLHSSPASIELDFGDDTYLESVEVLGTDGLPVVLDFQPTTALARHFSIPLPALDAGQYTVKWAVEGSDTHKLSGEFSFTLGDGDE